MFYKKIKINGKSHKNKYNLEIINHSLAWHILATKTLHVAHVCWRLKKYIVYRKMFWLFYERVIVIKRHYDMTRFVQIQSCEFTLTVKIKFSAI